MGFGRSILLVICLGFGVFGQNVTAETTSSEDDIIITADNSTTELSTKLDGNTTTDGTMTTNSTFTNATTESENSTSANATTASENSTFANTTTASENSTFANTTTESENSTFANATESGSTTQSNETTLFHNSTSSIIEDTTVVDNTTYPLDMCQTNPCLGGGECRGAATGAGFECRCPANYTGLRCETFDLCDLSGAGVRCENGSCVYLKGLRVCRCFLGDAWDEELKSCRRSEPPCFPNPCTNGGTCVNLDTVNYKCMCDSLHVGARCQIKTTCALNNTCLYGECVAHEPEGYLYCKCLKNYYWNDTAKECQVTSPPCQPNPCEHGGRCKAVSANTFNCTCADGYTGTLCDIRDYCTKGEDKETCENGKCWYSNATKTQYCACDESYHYDTAVHKCVEDELPCKPNPCQNDGLCVLLPPNSFRCICTDGYEGKDCSKENRCVLDGGNDFCSTGNCTMDYSLKTYYCSCGENEYFDYKSRACKVLDLCPLIECGKNEICINNTCNCTENFIRKDDKDECKPNFCPSKPCPSPDMTCEENLEGDARDFRCSCKRGFAFNGTHCNVAFCKFPEFNHCEQTCTMSKDNFSCGCVEPFQLEKDNKTCKSNKNEACTNTNCTKGTCVKNNHEESCLCRPGFIPVSGTCTDICSSKKKMTPGFCPSDSCVVDPAVTFRCKCDGKYILSEDKVTCTNRRMCSEDESGWTTCRALKAQCVDDWKSPRGFFCQCPSGHVENVDTGVCREICDVDENRLQCSLLGATCAVDGSGANYCKCPSYLQASAYGTPCDRPAKFSFLTNLPLSSSRYVKKSPTDGKRKKRSVVAEEELDYHLIGNDVSESMNQFYEGFQNANVLACKKLPDYLSCTIELQFEQQEKAEDLNRLKMSGVCQTTEEVATKTCLLPPSLVLRSDKIASEVSFRETDPCDPHIKEDKCGSETTCTSSLQKGTSFNCTCNRGFTVRGVSYPFGDASSSIELCKDINECELTGACPSSTRCVNTLGSYECLCLKGHRLTNDMADPKQDGCIELCKPNPCVHGLCEATGDHRFECRCDTGYKGALCDSKDKNYTRARTNSIIVGVVLGGILLVTVILFAAYLSRLRKKKMLEDPNQMFYGATEMADRGRTGITNNAYQRD